jgi:hypothetical protein
VRPEVGQVRVAASPGIGEMWLLVIANCDDNDSWESVVLETTGWYSEHFKAGSLVNWAERWFTVNTVAI